MYIAKETRNLLIAMLIGDGHYSKNGSLSVMHCKKQEEYIRWKASLISNQITKSSVFAVNNSGFPAFAFRTKCTKFGKLLRKIAYNHSDKYNSRLLNRLGNIGLAIWYMDDGNFVRKTRRGKVHGCELYLNVATSNERADYLIEWFKKKYDIIFRKNFNNGSYRLRCGTNEARKFIDIIRPFVNQVECMKYKINITEAPIKKLVA
jgi:LAGLIDADG DNA endonuclease family